VRSVTKSMGLLRSEELHWVPGGHVIELGWVSRSLHWLELMV
jgi:hypothetical protein